MGMFPPMWGRFYWRYKHIVALFLKYKFGAETELPADVQDALNTYIRVECLMLPCPGCAHHCVLHLTQTNPPRLTTAAQFQAYTEEFHNAVSTRLQKPVYTSDETEQAMLQYLTTYQLGEPEQFTEAFLQDFWNILFLTSYFFSPVVDLDAAVDPVDVERFSTFIRAWLSIAPFGFKLDEATQEPVRLQILAHFDQEKANNPDFLRTKALAFVTVLNLHNVAAPHFHRLPKTLDEMRIEFNRQFDDKRSLEASLAAQKEEEAQKKLKALHQQYQGIDPNAASTRQQTPSSIHSPYFVATIVLAALLGAFLLIAVCLLIRWRAQRSLTSVTRPLSSSHVKK